MPYTISKQNTCIKFANPKTGYLAITNLQLFVQALDHTTLLFGNAASANLHLQISINDIASIGGSAPAGTIDGILNQIAAILN